MTYRHELPDQEALFLQSTIPPQSSSKSMVIHLSYIYYNNVVVQTEKVHHFRKFLHNHPTNPPRTNSRFRAHICPILPIQSLSSNSSSSSRKFLRKKVLSREYHVTGIFHCKQMFLSLIPNWQLYHTRITTTDYNEYSMGNPSYGGLVDFEGRIGERGVAGRFARPSEPGLSHGDRSGCQ
jgi:hypothetical protein